ncbi:hypothetical protein FHR71_000903 [Methylobacterium sp. RAS18]|nr:hypothetical protein [Methylobacterium sp. RAS18]
MRITSLSSHHLLRWVRVLTPSVYYKRYSLYLIYFLFANMLIQLLFGVDRLEADPLEEHHRLMLVAIEKGEVERVRRLLQTPYVFANEPIVARNSRYNGKQWIYPASERCRGEIINLLLENGADPNDSGPNVPPPIAMTLYGMLEFRRDQTRQCLVSLEVVSRHQSTDLNVSYPYFGNMFHATPLQHVAMHCKHVPPDAARILRRYGADVNMQTAAPYRLYSAGSTPLHMIAALYRSGVYLDICIETAAALTEPSDFSDPDFEVRNARGARPVDLSAANCLRSDTDQSSHTNARRAITTIFLNRGSSAPVSGDFCEPYRGPPGP